MTKSKDPSQTAQNPSEAGQAARQLAESVGDVVKNWIEKQPYAAVGVALGIGWLYGRMHRPF